MTVARAFIYGVLLGVWIGAVSAMAAVGISDLRNKSVYRVVETPESK